MKLFDFFLRHATTPLHRLQPVREVGLVRRIVDAGKVDQKRLHAIPLFRRHAFDGFLDFLHCAHGGNLSEGTAIGKRDFIRQPTTQKY